MPTKKDYSAGSISVEDLRNKFDIIELSKKIKKRGDVLFLSQELKVRPRILKSAVYEGRIKNILPFISKSKAGILSSLRTDREVKIFYQKYNLKNSSARELIGLIKKWNKDIQKNPLILISKEEHEMILGTLMGDSSIRQRDLNSCFRFSHSIKQKEYCVHKKQIMSNFNLSEFRELKRKIRDSFIHAIDFSTKTHAIFNYYRNLFYSNGKKEINNNILGKLTPRSLAYWICDDGSYSTTQKYIILCTNSYSLEEHKLIKDFFIEKFGITPTIGFRDGKYYYLRFNKEDSRKLIEIVKPFIPNCMLYKIGEKINNDN